jgi:hypothetical protein
VRWAIADANMKVMGWPMIVGIVFVTCAVLVVTISLITSMLGVSSVVATAGGCAGAGVVAAILVTRRRTLWPRVDRPDASDATASGGSGPEP